MDQKTLACLAELTIGILTIFWPVSSEVSADFSAPSLGGSASLPLNNSLLHLSRRAALIHQKSRTTPIYLIFPRLSSPPIVRPVTALPLHGHLAAPAACDFV